MQLLRSPPSFMHLVFFIQSSKLTAISLQDLAIARIGIKKNFDTSSLNPATKKCRKIYSTRSLVCPFTLYSPKCSAQHYTEAKPLSRPSP